MKVSDIVKLLKAGYTPGEIAKLEDPASVLELISGGVEKDQVDECLSLITQESGAPGGNGDNAGGASPSGTSAENAGGASPSGTSAEPEGASASADPGPDYERMYNELLKKTKKQAMQTDMSGSNPPPKSTDEILKELAVDYM